MKEQVVAPPPIKPESPPLRWEDKVIKVGKTRVTLDSVIAAFHRGETPEEIAQNYDALSLAEVYGAIGYYLGHQSEVDSYLTDRADLRASIQSDVESRQKTAGIRERLLARKANPA